jgi:hypothetical protein
MKLGKLYIFCTARNCARSSRSHLLIKQKKLKTYPTVPLKIVFDIFIWRSNPAPWGIEEGSRDSGKVWSLSKIFWVFQSVYLRPADLVHNKFVLYNIPAIQLAWKILEKRLLIDTAVNCYISTTLFSMYGRQSIEHDCVVHSVYW